MMAAVDFISFMEAYGLNDRWTAAPMSISRAYHGVGVLGGKLYAVMVGIRTLTGRTTILSISLSGGNDPANTWTAVPPPPDSVGVRAWGQAVRDWRRVRSGSDTHAASSVEAYDPADGQ